MYVPIGPGSGMAYGFSLVSEGPGVVSEKKRLLYKNICCSPSCISGENWQYIRNQDSIYHASHTCESNRLNGGPINNI